MAGESIHDPLGNLVGIETQLGALEYHLQSEHRDCWKCIRKHYLCALHLAEEAVSLSDGDEEYRLIERTVRDLMPDRADIAAVRAVRRWLVDGYDADWARR